MTKSISEIEARLSREDWLSYRDDLAMLGKAVVREREDGSLEYIKPADWMQMVDDLRASSEEPPQS